MFNISMYVTKGILVFSDQSSQCRPIGITHNMMAKLFLMMYVNNIVIGYSPEFVIHYYPACW